MILIKQFLICWMHFTFFIKCAHCGGVGFWTSYKKVQFCKYQDLIMILIPEFCQLRSSLGLLEVVLDMF